MGRIQSVVNVVINATLVAVAVSIVATMVVFLASLAGWVLSLYLPFTLLETTGLWLLAGSAVTLAAAVTFAASMVSGTQAAQRELLERLAQEAEWDGDDEDEDGDDDDDEDEDYKPIFVTPKPREAAARRVLSRARRSK